MLAEQPKGDEEKPIQTHAMPGWGWGGVLAMPRIYSD